jgi:hypothetical protein
VLCALEADRAKEQTAESVPVGADHEQVGVARRVEQRFGGCVFEGDRSDVNGHEVADDLVDDSRDELLRARVSLGNERG